MHTLNHSLQEVWIKTAKNNSDLFEQVFGGKCIPTDAAKDFEELNEFRVSEKCLYHMIVTFDMLTMELFIPLPILFMYSMHAQLQ